MAQTSESPQQFRLNENVPAPTIFHATPDMGAMTNQWATSSMYITNTTTSRVPDLTPLEVIPGSTASGTRRMHRAETALPYGKTGGTSSWPPPITATSHFTYLAATTRPTYGGPHLVTIKPGILTAGLGGIDPTQ